MSTTWCEKCGGILSSTELPVSGCACEELEPRRRVMTPEQAKLRASQIMRAAAALEIEIQQGLQYAYADGFQDASLDRFQAEWGAWVQQALPKATTEGHLKKLEGEVVELKTAFKAEVPIADELADCILLCLSIAHRHGISAADAIRRKFEVNKTRKWEPCVNGLYQHDSSDRKETV